MKNQEQPNNETDWERANRVAAKATERALNRGTHQFLQLLDEFSLLPVEGGDDLLYRVNLVSTPDEKRLVLCVDWE
jgi:hypothetical protein